MIYGEPFPGSPDDHMQRLERLTADLSCCSEQLDKADAENDVLRTQLEEAKAALERINHWSQAYPLSVFPEPDLKRARQLLEAGGITLDAVSATAMRHVVKGVGEIARAALEGKAAP